MSVKNRPEYRDSYSQRNMSKLPVRPNGVKRLKLLNGPTQQ